MRYLGQTGGMIVSAERLGAAEARTTICHLQLTQEENALCGFNRGTLVAVANPTSLVDERNRTLCRRCGEIAKTKFGYKEVYGHRTAWDQIQARWRKRRGTV